MTSIIKVQNIQYTDGDAALTIADGGGVTAASSVAVTGDLTVDSGVLSVTSSDNKIRYTQGTNKGLVIQDAGIADSVEINFGTSANGIRAGLITGSNLSFYTGTAGGGTASKKMEIDTSGRVLKPTQPSFMIGKNNGTQTSAGTFIFNNPYHNEGSHYDTSNGRFTAPVAGVYHFSAFMLLMNNLNQGDYYWSFSKNGTALSYCYMSNNNANQHKHYANTIVHKMNAGDYMTVNVHNGGWYGVATQHAQFSGYLLG